MSKIYLVAQIEIRASPETPWGGVSTFSSLVGRQSSVCPQCSHKVSQLCRPVCHCAGLTISRLNRKDNPCSRLLIRCFTLLSANNRELAHNLARILFSSIKIVRFHTPSPPLLAAGFCPFWAGSGLSSTTSEATSFVRFLLRSMAAGTSSGGSRPGKVCSRLVAGL